MRASWIFKSRWTAALWAAGILWFAYSVAGSAPSSRGSRQGEHATDVTGATITDEDANKFEQAVNGL